MRAPSGYELASRYRLLEPVGRGGMGTVWRAHDGLLDRDVAVKEVRLPLILDEDLRAELCARTEREARATAMVAHPSVITVFDVITEDDRPWIVMELLHARSLDELVREHGPLPPRRAAEIGRQVLAALRAVHGKGILHRDVKPSNVLVTEDRAVLTDFGLAALDGDASITQAGIVLGSAGYIAPERVLGDRASPAADLWSFGATLYTAVEGRGLHGRRTAAAALAALTSGEPIPMERAGPLAPILRGLLQIDPEARLDGMRAALMLARVAAGGSAEEPLGGPAQRPSRTGSAAHGGAPRPSHGASGPMDGLTAGGATGGGGTRGAMGGSGTRGTTGGGGTRGAMGGVLGGGAAAMGRVTGAVGRVAGMGVGAVKGGGADDTVNGLAGEAPPGQRKPAHRGQHRADPRAERAPHPPQAEVPPVPAPRGQRRSAEGMHRRPAEAPPGRRRAEPEISPLLRQLTDLVRLILPRRFRPGNRRK
ncbi:serine/threonine-protein kinase [Sphaerisporangium sp. TRM90804]|uniref:serine/threonine-protein kinase n=1 Tax=Sphaerisporangium sp. TRM90804 TaxID=3031113 RepID=UPI002447AFD2|nr:serine/threonine-protein kinase [Sphaerisporangium sp. TRM90804]MDH2428834.1 serine/threonine-protein kinase [Sphaerisporangium sp. TRM90804]